MHYIFTLLILFTLSTTNSMATTYYVSPNGNDSANGRSHSNAWKTIDKVNRYTFNAGDDVYFKNDASWKLEILNVNWSGTANNRVIIGSYYLNNGVETLGLTPDLNKPKIIGSYSGPCAGTPGSCIHNENSVPTSGYEGLINIAGDYVTIQNIRVQHSAGRGIVLANKFHHVILENNEVYYTAGNSTIFNRGSSYNIFRNNDTSYCAVGWKNGDWVAVRKSGWPTCNSAVGSHHNIFENNYVHESYGEGIVLLEGGTNNIVRGNTLVAIRSTNIYMDNGSRNVIENNMIVGDRDGQFVRGVSEDGHRYGGGIDVKVETYPSMKSSIKNIVRNNLLVHSDGFLMGLEPAAELAGKKVGVKLLNNTLVETAFYVKLIDSEEFYDVETEIANNIFYGSKLKDQGCLITPNTISLHSNFWSHAQSRANCTDISGAKIGNPELKRSDWSSVGINNIPSADDFSLKDTSPARNAATTRSTPSIQNNEFDQVNNLSGNCSFDLTENSKDYNCNVRGNKSSMGAINSPLLLISAPMPPRNINVN